MGTFKGKMQQVTTSFPLGEGIAAYGQLLKETKQQTDEPEPIDAIPENHRSLVIVNISNSSAIGSHERAVRFISGLNTGETMKADVVTIVNGKIYKGLVFLDGVPGGLMVNVNTATSHQQVIIVEYK